MKTQFEDALPMMLYRLLGVIMPGFREIFATHGLTEQQWRVLRVLWEHQRSTPGKLSKMTLISPPSLAGVLERLEHLGLLKRTNSLDDRRQVLVDLLAKGKALEAQVEPLVNKAYESLQHRLSEKEWLSLYALINKICIAYDPDAIPIPLRRTGASCNPKAQIG